MNIKFPRATYHTVVPSTEELYCLLGLVSSYLQGGLQESFVVYLDNVTHQGKSFSLQDTVQWGRDLRNGLSVVIIMSHAPLQLSAIIITRQYSLQLVVPVFFLSTGFS